MDLEIKEIPQLVTKKWIVGKEEFTSYDKAKKFVEDEKEKIEQRKNAKKLLQIKDFDDHSLCENCYEYDMFLFKSTKDLKETENALIAYSSFFNIRSSAISEALVNTSAKLLIDLDTIYIGVLESDDFGSHFSFEKLSDKISKKEKEVKTLMDLFVSML